ncbi:MAG: hypothetical protein NWQ87_01700, partial [Litorivicinaceae bacterium]|nr:hypothetical protein [Litorivicinaceae bacterium]
MKRRSRFTKTQFASILREAISGRKIVEFNRGRGVWYGLHAEHSVTRVGFRGLWISMECEGFRIGSASR